MGRTAGCTEAVSHSRHTIPIENDRQEGRLFQEILAKPSFDVAEVLKVYGVTRLEELTSIALRAKVERDLEAVVNQQRNPLSSFFRKNSKSGC